MMSVIYGKDFHEMHARLLGPKSLLTLSLPNYKPSLADEKAEPRPDMSIIQ